jgi:hypothetical protein
MGAIVFDVVVKLIFIGFVKAICDTIWPSVR